MKTPGTSLIVICWLVSLGNSEGPENGTSLEWKLDSALEECSAPVLNDTSTNTTDSSTNSSSTNHHRRNHTTRDPSWHSRNPTYNPRSARLTLPSDPSEDDNHSQWNGAKFRDYENENITTDSNPSHANSNNPRRSNSTTNSSSSANRTSHDPSSDDDDRYGHRGSNPYGSSQSGRRRVPNDFMTHDDRYSHSDPSFSGSLDGNYYSNGNTPLDGAVESDMRSSRTTRETYNSGSNNIPACTVQCIFSKLQLMNDEGFPREPPVIKLLEDSMADQEEQESAIRRVRFCFKKLASNLEDDNCEYSKRLSFCMGLKFNLKLNTTDV